MHTDGFMQRINCTFFCGKKMVKIMLTMLVKCIQMWFTMPIPCSEKVSLEHVAATPTLHCWDDVCATHTYHFEIWPKI